jgi:hypothetical protein
MNGNVGNKMWRRLREKTEGRVPESVKFADVRDGAYTAAINEGAHPDHARILAGHRVAGTTDHYVKRQPRIVADACAAIEKVYFPAPA